MYRHAKFTLMDVEIFQTAPFVINHSFNSPSVRLLACVKCSVLHFQQFWWVLLCTCLQMAPSTLTGNIPTLISISTIIKLQRTLLEWYAWIWSKVSWSYNGAIKHSKLCAASLQIQFTTSEIIWNLTTSHSLWASSWEHSSSSFPLWFVLIFLTSNTKPFNTITSI